MRALRSVAKVWDGEFDQLTRASFGRDWRRVVAHVDNHDAAVRAGREKAAESVATKRFKATMRYTGLGLGIALINVLVVLFTHEPQTIIVRLPSGQQVVVTPAPTATPLPTAIGGTRP